jgi:hypothetical protein
MFTRSSANAACGGLQPPSARAAAKGQPSSPAQHHFKKLYLHRTPLCARGTRSFSNPLSHRGLLRRFEPSHAMSSSTRLILVSFLQNAATRPWETYPSLRDADKPFRMFRHVTAIPGVAPRIGPSRCETNGDGEADRTTRDQTRRYVGRLDAIAQQRRRAQAAMPTPTIHTEIVTHQRGDPVLPPTRGTPNGTCPASVKAKSPLVVL